MVKLLSPVASFEAMVKVISAGADEIYCGVKIPKVKYPGLSTRPSLASISTYDELGRVVEYAHNHGVKVIVTTEFPFLSKVIEREVRAHIFSCVEKGIDAIIAGDIGIILMIKKETFDIPIFASTYMASLNYEAVAFLRKLGVERVILERHLIVEEIEEIVRRNKDVEIEVFVHGPGCSNINVNCYFCFIQDSLMEPFRTDSLKESFKPYADSSDGHKARFTLSPMCVVKYKVCEVVGDERREKGFWPILDAYTFCALCKLPRLVETGVTGLKIVGRELPLDYQEHVTRIYRELIDLLEKDQLEAFQERLTLLRGSKEGMLSDACKKKRCYYNPLFHTPYKKSDPMKLNP